MKSPKLKAKLFLNYEDGSWLRIDLDHVIEIDIAEGRKQSIEFRQTKDNWIMSITKPLLQDRKLAKDFITVSKIGKEEE